MENRDVCADYCPVPLYPAETWINYACCTQTLEFISKPKGNHLDYRRDAKDCHYIKHCLKKHLVKNPKKYITILYIKKK
jgi:hypothetical protein